MTSFEIKGVHPHNGKLRIDFHWAEEPGTRPTRQRAHTGLDDTAENQMQAHFLRKQIVDMIDRNQFSPEQYCLLLPHSSYAKKQLKLNEQQDLTYEQAVDLYMQYYNELTDQGLKSPTSRDADRKVLTGETAQILFGLPLQGIQRKHMHKMQRQWEALKPDGTKRRNKTINNRIDAFRAMFKYLRTKLEIIKDDVTDALERRTKDTTQPQVFDADLMSDMYKDLYKNEGPEYANLYATICLLGLRVGEACGVSEDDFDLAESEVTIHRALVTDRKELTKEEKQVYIDQGKTPPDTKGLTYWKGTKTGNQRTLDCSNVLTSIFREQRLLNQHLPQVTVPVHRGGNIEHESFKPLFWRRSVRGSKGQNMLFDSESARNAYDRSKERLGIKTGEIPPIKDGRSTNASVIASTTGNVFKIQAQLGHSDIHTLQRHYAKHFKSHEKVDLESVFTAARAEVVPLRFSVVPAEAS